MRDHQIKVTFEGDCIAYELIHPESGCVCASLCTECGWDRAFDLDDARCPYCPEPSEECWLTSWAEAGEMSDYLHGEITFPVQATWDGDGPIIEVLHRGARRHVGRFGPFGA